MKTKLISLPALTLTLAACGGTDPGITAQALTAGELHQAIQDPRLAEVHVHSDLRARELELEVETGEEYVEARVLSLDPAGTIVLDFQSLAVTFADSTRFRTPTESREARASWVSAVQAALSSGSAVFVRASRLAGAPRSPDDASFAATDLRWEEKVEETKLELVIDQDNLKLEGASAELHVLGRVVRFDDATRIWSDDVDGERPGDDNGGANEAGDDNGGR